MSKDEIKALQRRYYEECNKGKTAAIAVLDELFAVDVVWHSARGMDIRGVKNLKESFNAAYNTFPDTHYTIDDMIVEGDKAATRFTFTGTHKGEFSGILDQFYEVVAGTIHIDMNEQTELLTRAGFRNIQRSTIGKGMFEFTTATK